MKARKPSLVEGAEILLVIVVIMPIGKDCNSGSCHSGVVGFPALSSSCGLRECERENMGGVMCNSSSLPSPQGYGI